MFWSFYHFSFYFVAYSFMVLVFLAILLCFTLQIPQIIVCFTILTFAICCLFIHGSGLSGNTFMLTLNVIFRLIVFINFMYICMYVYKGLTPLTSPEICAFCFLQISQITEPLVFIDLVDHRMLCYIHPKVFGVIQGETLCLL